MRKNGRIGPRRLPVFFVIAYLIVLSSSAFGFLLAQDGTHVQPDETVGELLSGSAPPETAVVSPASESLWRTTGVLILGAGLGVLLLLSWQRQRPSSGATRGGRASLEVIAGLRFHRSIPPACSRWAPTGFSSSPCAAMP